MTALQIRPRLLTRPDVEKLGLLLARNAVLNCVVESRLLAAPDLEGHRLGGQLWGVDDKDAQSLAAAMYHGGNLIPIGTDLSALSAIAEALARNGRSCSSIVGPASAVEVIWPILSQRWGPARIVRERQPFLVASAAAEIATDLRVRRVERRETEAFLPAAVAMFTEELQTSPVGQDLGAAYRSRVSDLIGSGRCFARFDAHGEVEFKAEIGALTGRTAQVQGVWVRPDLRGRGMGTAAMAQVLSLALMLAPTVSLYVNEFNVAARRMYQRLGFHQTDTLSTVLF